MLQLLKVRCANPELTLFWCLLVSYSLSICRYKLVLVHRAGGRLHCVTLVAIFRAAGKEGYFLVVLDSNRVRYLAIAVSYEYASQTPGFALIGG